MINTIETGIGLFPIIGIGVDIGFKHTLLISWPIGFGIATIQCTTFLKNSGPPPLSYLWHTLALVTLFYGQKDCLKNTYITKLIYSYCQISAEKCILRIKHTFHCIQFIKK